MGKVEYLLEAGIQNALIVPATRFPGEWMYSLAAAAKAFYQIPEVFPVFSPNRYAVPIDMYMVVLNFINPF